MNKLAILVASTLFFAACQSSVEVRLERARELSFAGQSKEAAAEYGALLTLLEGAESNERNDAAKVETLARLGDLRYLTLRDYRGAADAYRRLIREAPASEEAWAAREKLADLSRRFFDDLNEAIAQWQALAASGRPDADRFSYLVAKSYFELQDYEQSRKECNDLAARHPDSKWAADALFLLGTAWQFEGKHAESIPVFEEIEQRWPTSEFAPRARFQIGQSQLALEDPESALASYLEALKRHPDPQTVQAEIQRARRHLSEAVRLEARAKAGFRG